MSTEAFTTIATGTGSSNLDYQGVAAVGAKVYFGPYDQDDVRVLDTTDDSLSTIDTTGAGVTADKKYRDAAVVGTRIFFGSSGVRVLRHRAF